MTKGIRCLLCLGNGVTLYVDLEPMGGLQRFLCLWVNRPFDVIVLDSMDGINKIEVAFAMLLLSIKQVSSQCTGMQKTEVLSLLPSFRAEICSSADVLRPQYELVPAVDCFSLISSWFIGRGFEPRLISVVRMESVGQPSSTYLMV